MKKLFRVFMCGAMLLTCASSAFIVTKAILDRPNDAVEANADAMYAPDFNSMYSTPGQNWLSGSDPAGGTATDYATYSTSINSSVSGYSTTTQAMTVTTGKDTSYNPYIQLRTSSTKEFRAMYVPFRFQFSVPAYTKATYSLSLTLFAGRSNADGGGADYSTELFSFGESPATPTTWFYHQDDFTPTTNRGYSVYRVAKGTKNDSESHSLVQSFSCENKTGSSVTKYYNMGVFCYMESSGYSGIFTGKITCTACTYTYSPAIATLDNGGTLTLITSPAEAVSKFNEASGQTLTLMSDIDFSDYGNPVFTSNGTINLQSYDILLGTHLMYVRGNITFNGTTTAEIIGSAAHSVLFLDTAVTVYLSGYVSVKSENTSTATARAILVANASAKLYLGEDAFIYSNYYGIQIDNGYFYCQGRIFAGTGTSADVPYAINIGSSDDSYKYVYLYGSTCRALKINTGNLAKTRLYAKNGTTSYSASFNITLTVINSFSLGDIFVRDVTTSGSGRNDNKFLLSHSEYQVYASGSNMTIQYKKFSVTYSLSNATQSGGSAYASKAANLSFTIVPDTGYVLPTSIVVKRGDDTLVQNTHYTYDSSTGEVVIYKENISGALTVTAYAQKIITIRFLNPEGDEIAETIVHNGSFSFPLPTIAEVTHPDYYSSISWYENPELTGTSFGGGYNYSAFNSTDFYAKFVRTSQDYLDYFVGVELHFEVDPISTSDNRDTNACRSEGEGALGYYASAKAYFQTSLTNSQRQTFCSNDEYLEARTRFNAWANANGERLNLNNYTIVSNGTSPNIFTGVTKSDSLPLIIVVTSLAAVTAIGFIVVYKRKHR